MDADISRGVTHPSASFPAADDPNLWQETISLTVLMTLSIPVFNYGQ